MYRALVDVWRVIVSANVREQGLVVLWRDLCDSEFMRALWFRGCAAACFGWRSATRTAHGRTNRSPSAARDLTIDKGQRSVGVWNIEEELRGLTDIPEAWQYRFALTDYIYVLELGGSRLPR
jgi:hypothetical protein